MNCFDDNVDTRRSHLCEDRQQQHGHMSNDVTKYRGNVNIWDNIRVFPFVR